MTLGLVCAFLLGILALLLRFGIPRATAETLAGVKWFALGLAAMFGLLVLFAIGGAGGAARLGWSGVVRLKSELGGQRPDARVLLEATVSESMAANDKGWVAWEQAGGAKTSNVALSVTFPDGELVTLGTEYDGVYWNAQRSSEATSYYYLSRGDAVTLQAVVTPDGVRVDRVLGGHRAANVQHKARMDYWSSLLTGAVAGGSVVAAPLLLLLAARRRRRALGPAAARDG